MYQTGEDSINIVGTLNSELLFHRLSRSIGRIASILRFPAGDANPELAKILWLVRLRWIAIGLSFVLSVPALKAGLLNRETVPIFLALIGILMMFNLLTQLIWTNSVKQVGQLDICFHLSLDLVVLTVFLSLTGGFANPFILVFLLNASLGSILIRGRLGWPFLLLLHIFLALLELQFSLAHLNDVGSHLLITFATYHFLLLSFWLVMRSLGDHLEKQQDQRETARVLLERRDRLRAVGALAAGFSHEFASPLNAAKLRLERILKSSRSEDLSEALAAIRVCEDVIRQMNSSQLDARSFQFKNVVVSDLLSDIVETWREEHPGARIKLEVSGNETCLVPPVNFAQVVLNLLDNAIESRPDGEIRVWLKNNQQSFELLFEDEGPGIPEVVVARIGEPFVTTKPGGTGLGIFVSQLFAQSLGGEFSVCNGAAGGALIRLEWPMNRDPK